jgi:hypothetical protein
VGAPTLAILAETNIQNIEHKQTYPIVIKYQILGYFIQVDDIPLIYDQSKTNTDENLTELKCINQNVSVFL